MPDVALLESLDERLPIYFELASNSPPLYAARSRNQILVRNYKLGPWIHAASDLINWKHGW